MPSKTILAICAVALSSHAWAQYRQPTEQEVERAKQQYRQPTDAEVEVAKKKYRQPPEAQLNRAASSQSPVNLDAIPMPKGNDLLSSNGWGLRFRTNSKPAAAEWNALSSL